MSGDPAAFAQDCFLASRALRRLPADVKKAMKAEVREQVAEPFADAVRSALTGPHASQLRPAVKTKLDVTPRISIGGARKVASGGANARQLVFGVEFGGGSRRGIVRGRRGVYQRRVTRQFRKAAFVYPTWTREQDAVLAGYGKVLDTVLDDWNAGG